MTLPTRTAATADRLPSPAAVRGAVRRTYARAAALAATVLPERAACAPHSGLGCGTPTAFAGLRPGERVLDLGCGAGFDCLAAAVDVGRTGRVVGIDLTPEMVRLARRHAADAGVANVQVLQAALENLPLAEASFDVVISNCVINLCADKARVLAEACRVLKPGGRLAVADIVAVAPLPRALLADLALHTGCVAGATPLAELLSMLQDAGFAAPIVEIEPHSRELIDAWALGLDLARYVAAARITAGKPGAAPPGAHDAEPADTAGDTP